MLKEIGDRLKFLVNVGLNYLSLSRSAETLSGGEAQRIRLASQIGAGLVGVMYVLDEPSIGLHQRDNERLLETLIHLRNLGNTVIVVEHDEDAIRAADHVIDIGPGAGVHGGQVVAEGTVDDIMAQPDSLTGQFLSGKREIAIPAQRVQADPTKVLKLSARQQPEGRDADAAGRPVYLHHRRVRLRQIDADQRYAVPDRPAPAQRRHHRRASAVPRSDRPGTFRQGDRHRPEPDRPYATL